MIAEIKEKNWIHYKTWLFNFFEIVSKQKVQGHDVYE